MVFSFDLVQGDLKQYPHFDAPIPLNKIKALVTDPKRVATNAFFPFIRYSKKWQPFRTPKGARPNPKERLIRYAARRDAYIYSYYRYLISIHYEEKLHELNIEHCPIAYRRIPSGPNHYGNKCNIDFAKDAFDFIAEIGDCSVIALDISKFFENIDHHLLEKSLCDLLNVDKLSEDFAAVFRNVTKYRHVEKEKLYERLGLFGVKGKRNGRVIKGFLKPYSEIDKQLCSPREFREKVCGGDPHFPSLIEKNELQRGIPQGAPISDILANLYLLNFDVAMNALVESYSGKYWRYSDDILVVVPGDGNRGKHIAKFARAKIKEFGSHLEIRPEKSSVLEYRKNRSGQSYSSIDGEAGKNGLEYLGFRFDGKSVFLRDSTLSNFYRKLAFSARKEARTLVNRNPDFDLDKLKKSFQYKSFFKKFGRVNDFENVESDYKKWTFWTYSKRSSELFGLKGRTILKQMSRHRCKMRSLIHRELEKAYK